MCVKHSKVFAAHASSKNILNLGVSQAVHKQFKSYLTDRWRHVRIGTTFSAPATLSYGLPQGSVLSPFYLTSVQTAYLQFLNVVILNGMLITRKHFSRVHY